MGIKENIEGRINGFKESLKQQNRVGVLVHKEWSREEGPSFWFYQFQPWEQGGKQHHITKQHWAVDMFEYSRAYEDFRDLKEGEFVSLLPLGFGFSKLSPEEEIKLGADLESLSQQFQTWVEANLQVQGDTAYIYL